MEKPKDYLEKCEYISQDGDTVYIDEEALEECMESYAKQYAANEMYEALCDNPSDLATHLKNIINELKQE